MRMRDCPAAHTAVEHQRVLERRDVRFAQQRPQAQLAHQPGAVLRQGDLAAVEGGVLQRVEAVLFEHGGAQSAAAQRPRQGQAGRPGTHDDEVEFHGGAAYVRTTRRGLTQVKPRPGAYDPADTKKSPGEPGL